jgi:hypothetical protein
MWKVSSRIGKPLDWWRIDGERNPMADYSHTIDRWDDVTGEKLVEQIAAVGDYLVAWRLNGRR